MFASNSVAEHLVRGIIGFSALVGAFFLVAAAHGLLALAALPIALLALRGCPTCWLLGLVQTVTASLRGTPSDRYCVDGSCALQNPDKPTLPQP